MPELYIITGSNGAGKSSIGPEYLPEQIRLQGPVFDGDKLFVEKRNELWRNLHPPKECKKLAYAFVTETFDQLVNDALTARKDFAYEGHFTNEATWDIPRQFKSVGYSIHLVFLGLDEVTLSNLRVIDRSESGGHYVDPKTVEDNFFGNLEKLNIHYEMFNSVQIIDTSENKHKVLCVLKNGETSNAIAVTSLPFWFHQYLPSITKRIADQATKLS